MRKATMASSLEQRAVVCGLDGSYIARATTVTAAAFAARLECPLLLIYLPDPDDPAIRGAGTVEEARNAAAEAARPLVTPILDEHGIEPELTVELDDPFTALIEIAEAREAQLLVVGSRGAVKGAGSLGGLSRRIVRHAPCPVVVVPPRAATMTPLAIKSGRDPVIVCGIDDQHAVRTLLFAIDLAARMHARLVFVHSFDARLATPPEGVPTEVPFEARAVVEADRNRGHAFQETRTGVAIDQSVRAVASDLTSGDPAEAVRTVAESETADLIVVGSRGRGPLRSALLGSVSSDLADAAAIPIAILPASAHIAPLSGHYELRFGHDDRH